MNSYEDQKIKQLKKEILNYLYKLNIIKEIKLENIDKELKKIDKLKKNEIYEKLINTY